MSRAMTLYLSVLLGGTVLTPPPAIHGRRPADLRASLDSLITARVSTDSFSGVVLISSDGRAIYQRAAGMRDRTTRAPVTMNTKFQIASTTKLFTQIAIRQLEQQGRLSLSDTLGKFLPHYHNATARSKVTVEQLLDHRSGIGSFWNATFLARHERVKTISDYVELFQDDSLLFPPGTSEAYSNGGYVLLGAIIERVTGQPYHEYVRDHVFTPAGMHNTMPYVRGAALENAAIGYTTQPLGPVAGDTRLAGAGPRPGAGARMPTDTQRIVLVPGPGSAASSPPPPPGARLRLIGPDGKELTQEEARAAIAAHTEGRPRQPNTQMQPGVSGPAGDDYSTAEDFVRLAQALTTHVLLDSARTAAVLGPRYAAGGVFRAAGGGPGVNAEFSIAKSGEVVVVLSNYDPPAATTIAQFIRQRALSTTR